MFCKSNNFLDKTKKIKKYRNQLRSQQFFEIT